MRLGHLERCPHGQKPEPVLCCRPHSLIQKEGHGYLKMRGNPGASSKGERTSLARTLLHTFIEFLKRQRKGNWGRTMKILGGRFQHAAAGGEFRVSVGETDPSGRRDALSFMECEFLNTGSLVRALPPRSQPSDDCSGGLGGASP